MKTIFRWVKRQCCPTPSYEDITTEWDREWLDKRLTRVLARHHEKLHQQELTRLRNEHERLKQQVEEQNDWP